MNRDQEAELRRKLSMTSVPKPPDGLLERIKADIPKYLEPVPPKRTRFTLELRIAASLVLLIGSAWLAVRLISRQRLPSSVPFAAIESKKALYATPPPPAATAPPASVAQPAAEVPKPVVQIAEARQRKKDAVRNEPVAVPAEISGRVEGGVAGGVIGGVAAPSPPPEAAAKTANTDILARSAVADEVTLTPQTLFGVEMNSRRLDAQHIDSVVQHFAPPDTRPHRELRVDADASPEPMDTTHDVIRVSIDAPAGENAPVASDAKLEIEFDPEAVVSHRAIVGGASASERVIVTNASATLLFDVELAPNLSRRQRIATVRVTWRSVVNGKEQVIERVIHRRDIASTWDSASARTKLASLAAAWAEAARNGGPTDEIARRAREAGFDELADVASRQR